MIDVETREHVLLRARGVQRIAVSAPEYGHGGQVAREQRVAVQPEIDVLVRGDRPDAVGRCHIRFRATAGASCHDGADQRRQNALP
jgi:hypothetical protein